MLTVMVYWKEIKKLTNANDHVLALNHTQKNPTKFSTAGEQFLASPPLSSDSTSATLRKGTIAVCRSYRETVACSIALER